MVNYRRLALWFGSTATLGGSTFGIVKLALKQATNKPICTPECINGGKCITLSETIDTGSRRTSTEVEVIATMCQCLDSYTQG